MASRQLAKWGIGREHIHKGTSKQVYVKRVTNAEPKDPWAYLTSVEESLDDPEIIVKEYKYTRYLCSIFDNWIIPEFPIDAKNKELTDILNRGRGLLITKKHIVESIKPIPDPTPLLEYMMSSTDHLIDHSKDVMNGTERQVYDGFANLDLKAANIGLFNGRFFINDNGANMFYPIPIKYRDYYRDAIKLVGLCNLVGPFGLTEAIFMQNKHLYPDLDAKRAIELVIVGLDKKEKNEIIAYAKARMLRVEVDGVVTDLSSLFDDILFPQHLVLHYGTNGTYNFEDFKARLKILGLVPTEREIAEARIKERTRRVREEELIEQERLELNRLERRQAEERPHINRNRNSKNRNSKNRNSKNRNRNSNSKISRKKQKKI